MITQAILDLLHGLAATLGGWLEAIIPPAPGFVADINEAISTTVAAVGEPIRHFLPIGPAVNIAIVTTGLIVFLGAIRFGRRVLSLFTGGGGNA